MNYFLNRLEKSRVNFAVISGILADLDVSPDKNDPILDIGCGMGTLVYVFRQQGYRAFGADLRDDFAACLGKLEAEHLLFGDSDILRTITHSPYRLPFPDEQFRFICSQQVLEHVHDKDTFFAESARVLKPGGLALHVFPPRWCPIEGHSYVPFASVFQGERYLRFWAWLGIRNSYQKNLRYREAAARNARYLAEQTSYLPRKAVGRSARRYFSEVRHVEHLFLKYRLPGGKVWAKVPGIPLLAGSLVMQALLLKK